MFNANEIAARLSALALAEIYYGAMAHGRLPAVKKVPAGYAFGAYRSCVIR